MSNGKDPTAYDYFRFGHDTLMIASILKITEAEALKQVSIERSAFLGRGDPYQRQKASIGPIIKYAGHANF